MTRDLKFIIGGLLVAVAIGLFVNMLPVIIIDNCAECAVYGVKYE